MENYISFYERAINERNNKTDAKLFLIKHNLREIADKCKLGYIENWSYSRDPEEHKSNRLIFPIDNFSYFAIDTSEEKETPFKHLRESLTNNVSYEPIVYGSNKTPFIVDDPLSALSLIAAGVNDVIILRGTGTKPLIDYAKKHPQAIFSVLLSNGIEKNTAELQKKIEAALEDNGFYTLGGLEHYYSDFYNRDILGGCINAAESLEEYPDNFKEKVSFYQDRATEFTLQFEVEQQERLNVTSGVNMVNVFLDNIENSRDFEPMQTGIEEIDHVIGGGLMRKTLVTISAAPGAGKTALAQWITENLAKSGRDILYINLEMDRAQLLARSLSRISWQYFETDLSALDILRGYKWSGDTRKTVMESATKYKELIAKHFVYNPDGITNSISDILNIMNIENARLKAAGRSAPIICIDYLQLINSENRDATEGLKKVIYDLKQFATENNTTVILISANNRDSNKAGITTMESSRDTSAIEYSGDLMIGLSYTAIEDERKDDNGKPYTLSDLRKMRTKAIKNNEEIPEVCKETSIKILKNRFGVADARIDLIFDGKHSLFTVIDRSRNENPVKIIYR